MRDLCPGTPLRIRLVTVASLRRRGCFCGGMRDGSECSVFDGLLSRDAGEGQLQILDGVRGKPGFITRHNVGMLY